MNSVIINVCGIILAALAATASNENCEPQQAVLTPPFTFSYRGKHNFMNVIVNFKNWFSDVFTIYETGENKAKNKITKYVESKRDAEEHRFKITNHKIKPDLDFITIYLEVNTSEGCSKNITIIQGRALKIYSEVPKKGYEVKNDCLKPCPCRIEVDLEHACTDSVSKATQTEAATATVSDTKKTGILPDYNYFDSKTPTNNVTTSPHVNILTSTVKTTAGVPQTNNNQRRNVLIYVIISVIVTCVIILVIYISVKKYCHRNSQPDVTMELDIYATATELVYADLSLVHRDTQPKIHDEEATYAQIIGVFKPEDKNVKK